ncbi:Ger(x)C family spore germination protein [Paenibacillus eucommiae]|uniref:Spore germination protein KC n=1 Tax=Paenibacillus eucommiae TaxID=1355755 RepID=A0ABS4IZ44_9BACL|nr:Ger(x)C family spore germination protein [Paenibacillus eucommiae]MBP1992236.1 spore germination protein KC [Paenibacillus eucommiae]
MVRKLFILFLSAVLLVTVTGCWNRRELNTLAITVGLGIDKAGDKYKVSAQVVNPGEAASQKGVGIRSPVSLYQATGSSIFEAVRKMTKESPRKIYSSHVRVVIIGESLAREGIGDVLDYMSRDHEFRTDFYIVLAREGEAANLLSIMTSLENIPSIGMFDSLETSQKAWAPTVKVTLDKLISDLTSEGIHPVLTGIKGDIEKGKNNNAVEKSRFESVGLAVFNGDKLVGWLGETESKAYNYITDNVQSTVGYAPCPDGGGVSLEVIRSKTNLKGKLVNGSPAIDVNIRTEANVGEVACRIDLTKTKSIEELETISEQIITDFIEAAIKRVQKQYKVDIFGFGEVFRRTEPKIWKKFAKKWDKQFANLPVNVNIDFKIRRLGTVNNSYLEEMKK